MHIYRPIKGIGGRLLIAFVPIVLLSAIAISGVSALSGLRSGERQVINQLESVATLKEAEIETWLRGLTANLSIMLAGGDAIERANELLEGTPAAGGHQEAYDELQGRFQQTIAQVGLFEQVLLINPQGQVVLSTDAAEEALESSFCPRSSHWVLWRRCALCWYWRGSIPSSGPANTRQRRIKLGIWC